MINQTDARIMLAALQTIAKGQHGTITMPAGGCAKMAAGAIGLDPMKLSTMTRDEIDQKVRDLFG